MSDTTNSRQRLDQLFLFDATASLLFGVLALASPHNVVAELGGGYNHSTHEALRLYGCLRIAVGWILFNIRSVDDGKLRRSTCEALCVCYILQSIAVLRAQLTDRAVTINWVALFLLVSVGSLYGNFRFGGGGDRIKIYELPSASSRFQR